MRLVSIRILSGRSTHLLNVRLVYTFVIIIILHHIHPMSLNMGYRVARSVLMIMTAITYPHACTPYTASLVHFHIYISCFSVLLAGFWNNLLWFMRINYIQFVKHNRHNSSLKDAHSLFIDIQLYMFRSLVHIGWPSLRVVYLCRSIADHQTVKCLDTLRESTFS